jgi:hypothetical protein
MALGRRRGNDAPTSTGPTSGRESGPESGQALLELALVTPILVLLVLAIFQFAYVLETQIGLTNAVREAARRVVTSPSSTVSWTEDQLLGSGGDAGLLAENIHGYDPSRVVSPSPQIRICSFDVDGVTNYRVDISVTYSHPIFFPIPGSDNLATLTAATQMRIEHDDSLDAGEVSGLCSVAWP